MVAAWALFRPVARFARDGVDHLAAARSIEQLPRRSAWLAAGLVVAFSITASAAGVYTPADADLRRFTQVQVGAALLFYAAVYAILYSYFTYFVVNDLAIAMRRHWRSVLHFSVGTQATEVTPSTWGRRGGLARRLGVIFLVIGVLPVLLLGMDLTLFAPLRSAQGLSTGNVVALDLMASLYVILASVYFVSRSLVTPARELFEAHEAVRRGDLQYQAAVLTNDELGEVSVRFNSMVVALRERELMKTALQRYLSPGVASELIASGGLIASRSVVATVMFTDIEGFTALSETMTPQDTVDLLNAYFTLLNVLIAREGGTVNNFLGDAVVAIFNVPTLQTDHAYAAVRAALAIQRALEQQRFTLSGGRSVALPTRIGINTGPVCAGSFGSVERQGYTVYGDAVNLAARIEPQNKRFGTRILVSHETRMQAAQQGCEASQFSPLQEIQVPGRQEPVMLYTLT
jgi:class 3 adenylate cyclase